MCNRIADSQAKPGGFSRAPRCREVVCGWVGSREGQVRPEGIAEAMSIFFGGSVLVFPLSLGGLVCECFCLVWPVRACVMPGSLETASDVDFAAWALECQWEATG